MDHINSISITQALSRNSPLVLDGALATHLESLGADLSGSLWSASLLVTNPSLICQTHLSYYRAGAQIATTASYQASILGLVKYLGIAEDEAKSLIIKSVQLAQQARRDYTEESRNSDEEDRKEKGEGKDLWIAGSVGPYGAFLADGSEYRGDYSIPEEAMKTFHRGRIEALIEAGVDILAIETIPSFSETKALLSLLTLEFPETPAWFSFTIQDDRHISDGTSLSNVLGLLEGSQQVISVGVNCVSEEKATSALKEMQRWTKKSLIVYPNSGESWNATSRTWQGQRNEGDALVSRVRQWRDGDARIIGGCCRTRPEDIRLIVETLGKIGQ